MTFTLSDIVAATQGLLTGSATPADQPLSITTDSRSITSPCVFWAIPGERVDGHAFVSAAIERGAVACVVRQRTANVPAGIATIEVDDTIEALGRLARWHRLRLSARFIGITGSFGKTTTREMIAAVLGERLHVFQSQKNFNNHIGLPLSLLEIGGPHQAAVLELGASAVGEIQRLCTIARPQIGVITGIGRAHSAGFGGLRQIRNAKAELAAALPADGHLFLPGDDSHCLGMAARAACRVTFVGRAPHNEIRAEALEISNGRLTFRVGQRRFTVHAAGAHFVRNALFAVGLGRAFGLADDEIAAGLEAFQPVPGRCQLRAVGPWTLIDDSYNASPEATVAACHALGQWQTNGRRVLVCGDMLELGHDMASGHEDVGIAAAEAGLDVVLAYGTNAPTIVATARAAGIPPDSCGAFRDFESLLERLSSELAPGDVILVKGSRAMRMERVVDWLSARAGVLTDARDDEIAQQQNPPHSGCHRVTASYFGANENAGRESIAPTHPEASRLVLLRATDLRESHAAPKGLGVSTGNGQSD